MPQDSIKCPQCSTQIPLSEALSHDIEERAREQYAQQLKQDKKVFEESLKAREAELEIEIRKVRQKAEKEAEQIREELKAQQKKIEAKLKAEALESVNAELSDLKDQVESSRVKLKTAQENEIAFRKKQRELEEKEASLQLELERKLDEQKKQLEDQLFARFEEQHKLKDLEKDKRLADAMKQVEDLKRKMEQGSQQTQGEVLEVELEEQLKREFSFDLIEAVGKGIRGGDIIQTVKTQSGKTCGKIIWETKRTKSWSDGWIQKVKDDQREAKADLAVIVSEALPTGFHHFRQIKGVWVTDIPSALSLALALRVVLINVATAKEIEAGKDDKKDLIYRYVTGPEFKNRVTAIVDGFQTMKDELEAEKRAMTKIWGKREKQIDRIISNTAGMYGDLEGLGGNAIQNIKSLELPDEDEESVAEKVGNDLF